MNIQQFLDNQGSIPYTLPNNLDVWSWSVPFVSEKSNHDFKIVAEIMHEVIIRETRSMDDELTYEEQIGFDRIMNSSPALRAIVAQGQPAYNREDVLSSQLEMVLHKKKIEKEHSEQIIKGLPLHDSIIDKEVIDMVGEEAQNSPMMEPQTPEHRVFNYIKGFDIHNEKRPVKH